MKRNRKMTLLVFTIASLMLVHCKKEETKNLATSETKESAAISPKAWLARQQAALVKSGLSMRFAAAEKVDWDNAIAGIDGLTSFIPVYTDNQLLGKYLKITKGTNGAITGGNYVYLYPTMDKQANTYLLEGKNIPTGFSGTLLEYGLNNQWLASKVYEKGSSVAGKTTKLALKPISGKDNTAAARAECKAYYLETYLDGVLVNEVYLYTICVKEPDEALVTDDGSGGGGDEDAAALAYFDRYCQSTSTPASVNAPATIADPTPNSFTHTWTVASSLLGEGAWKVTGTTRMDWYTKKYYNMNTNAFEYKYDIIYLKTLNTAMISNAIGIESTWEPAPVQDNIYENNTDKAYGRSQVTGKVRHKSLILKVPFTNVGLPPREENIINDCNTYAK